VVKTSIPIRRPGSTLVILRDREADLAHPRLRPIQLRCMILTFSGQSSRSRSSSQPVGVRGDPHHPLAHVALEHREVAAVAAALGGDLLVGEHRAQPGHQLTGASLV
jgi:hypothetical protein